MAQPAFSLSDALSGYQSGLQAHTTDVTKKLDEAKGVYESRISDANKEEASLSSDALKPPTLAPPPQPQQTNPAKVWGSAAMALAMLGGLLTRRPLVNSLNAGAAVMNAYKQQDAAASQQAYEVWKTENENAVKMAQWTITQYKTALAKIDSDKKTALSDFTATAKALGDENAAYVAQHYGLDAAVRYTDAMQAHTDRMQEQQPKIDEEHQRLQNYLGIMDARKAFIAAQKSGKPDAIAAAQASLTSAVQTANDFNLSMGKSSTAKGGDQTFLKDKYDKAAQRYNSLLSAPAKDQKALDVAKADMDAAEGDWKRSVEGGVDGGGGGNSHAVDPKIEKANIEKAKAIMAKGISRDQVRAAFIQDGGSAADFDKAFPAQK